MDIVQRLRGECPWDMKQTLDSIKHLYIEEAYELCQALESGDAGKIEEEFGDMLYILLMGIRIASEKGFTSYEKVGKMASEKLIRRHPHVFEKTPVSGETEVLKNWEHIKQEEKKGKEGNKGYFHGIPKSLPALLRAQMVQERAARVGFDWPSTMGPLEKIKEETGELEEHLESRNAEELECELGDLLFSVVNLARHTGARAEEALGKANKKFESRFEEVRRLALERALDLSRLDIEELDKLWDEVKKTPPKNT